MITCVKITSEQVQKLAELSMFRLSSEELTRFSSELNLCFEDYQRLLDSALDSKIKDVRPLLQPFIRDAAE